MARNRHRHGNRCAAEDGVKSTRGRSARTDDRRSGMTRRRILSEEDFSLGTPSFIDVFHYEPRRENTDYHLFQKLRFYLLPDHSLRRRPELGYVRLHDMVHGAEPLPYPVELSCGVFACMEQRLDKKGNSQRYPDQSVVGRALDTGRFLRCVDFREYLETMWHTEKMFWEKQKKSIKSSPLQPTLQTLFHVITEPVRGLDFGEMCERLALMEQSYSEDAGQRCSLTVSPDLPVLTAGELSSQLTGQLEKTFELFLVASEVRQLPQLPQLANHSCSSEDEEWIGATQLMLSLSTEDLLTCSSHLYICCCTHRLGTLIKEAGGQTAVQAAEDATAKAAEEISVEEAEAERFLCGRPQAGAETTAVPAVQSSVLLIEESTVESTAECSVDYSVGCAVESTTWCAAGPGAGTAVPKQAAATQAVEKVPRNAGQVAASKVALEVAVKAVAEATASTAANATALVSEGTSEGLAANTSADVLVHSAVKAAIEYATPSLKLKISWNSLDSELEPSLNISPNELSEDPISGESPLGELQTDTVDKALKQLEDTVAQLQMREM